MNWLAIGAVMAVTLRCSVDAPGLELSADCSRYADHGHRGSCPRLCSVVNDVCTARAEIDCDNVPSRSEVEVCGVPMRAPLAAVERSDPVQPIFVCPQQSDPAPRNVTMKGNVLSIPSGQATSLDGMEVWTVIRDGTSDDGMPDVLVGQAVDVAANDEYEYRDVPTETELVIVTNGRGTVVEYNVFLRNRDVSDRSIVRTIYTDAKNVRDGNAVFGQLSGEVRDCDGAALRNAVVGVDLPGKDASYISSSTGTSSDGRFEVDRLPAGPITVAAAGVVEGDLVAFGFVQARIFDEMSTLVVLSGMQPQNP